MDILKKAISITIFLVLLIWLCKALTLGNYPDFNVFYGGLKAYLAGGNPYKDVIGSSMKFLYPPIALFFFLPVAFFERAEASIIWTVLSIILFITSIVFLFKTEKRKIFSNEFFILSSFSFLMFPLKFNLGMGQFNNVNLFLLSLFLLLTSRGRFALSGTAVGLSLILKVFPVLLLPYLLIIKQFKAFQLSVLVVIAGVAIGFVVVRQELTEYFFGSSLLGTLRSWPLDYYNQALSGLLGRWLGVSFTTLCIKYFLTFLLIGASFFIYWKKRSVKSIHLLAASSIFPLSLITLTFSWQHYFVLTMPAYLLLYFRFRKKKRSTKKYFLLFTSYVLVALNLAHPSSFPLIFQWHVFYGTLLLLALQLEEIYHAK
ncbi:MAG: DUF2029 domain-containing protein [Candidatus Levybacteria bacterium]|nr:DUF2029 domain-containing protein [Candidatus Levybacteria bacterium]